MVKIKSIKCKVNSESLEIYNEMYTFFESKLQCKRGNHNIIWTNIISNKDAPLIYDLEYASSIYVNDKPFP